MNETFSLQTENAQGIDTREEIDALIKNIEGLNPDPENPYALSDLEVHEILMQLNIDEPLSPSVVLSILNYFQRIREKKLPYMKDAQCMRGVNVYSSGLPNGVMITADAWGYNEPGKAFMLQVNGTQYEVPKRILFQNTNVKFSLTPDKKDFQIEHPVEMDPAQISQLYNAVQYNPKTQKFISGVFERSGYRGPDKGASKVFHEKVKARDKDAITWDESIKIYSQETRPVTHFMKVEGRTTMETKCKQQMTVRELFLEYWNDDSNAIPHAVLEDNPNIDALIQQLRPMVYGVKIRPETMLEPGDILTWSDHLVIDFFPLSKKNRAEQEALVRAPKMPSGIVIPAETQAAIQPPPLPKSDFRMLTLSEIILGDVMPVDVIAAIVNTDFELHTDWSKEP